VCPDDVDTASEKATTKASASTVEAPRQAAKVSLGGGGESPVAPTGATGGATSSNFVPLSGAGGPGKASVMVGVNLEGIDYVYGCFDDREGVNQSVLRLVMRCGRVVQITGREEVEAFLKRLGLEGQPWELQLERDIH
jgi:hypothetical protein